MFNFTPLRCGLLSCSSTARCVLRFRVTSVGSVNVRQEVDGEVGACLLSSVSRLKKSGVRRLGAGGVVGSE